MSLTDLKYHELVDNFFKEIESAVETIIDNQDADIDIIYEGSVLKLEFADKSQMILNKQVAIYEIWIASKFGGYHFSYHNGQWVDLKNNKELIDFFNAEFYKQSGIKIEVIDAK